MRLIIAGLTLALAASAPLAASTQAPVTTAPLAPGEVLLEINAFGIVTTRADRATLMLTANGNGETEAQARAEAERSAAQLRTLLRGQGIADADIRALPVTSYATDSMAAANAMVTMVDENAMVAEEPTSTPSVTANAPVEVVFRDVNRVPAIQAELAQRGYFSLQGLAYALADDNAARRQARAQALQHARADAESYASALNMRIVRVVRVTERLGLDLLGMMASESQWLVNLFSAGAMEPTGPDIQTMVTVGVDYALAPR